MGTFHFTNEELKLVQSAVRNHVNVYGHDEADLLHSHKELLKKVQSQDIVISSDEEDLLRSSLRDYSKSFGHDEADILEELKRLQAKISLNALH